MKWNKSTPPEEGRLPPQAREHVRELLARLEAQPEDVAILLRVGAIYQAQQLRSVALGFYREAGEICWSRGQRARASQIYELVLQYTPNDPDASRRLAELSQHRGGAATIPAPPCPELLAASAEEAFLERSLAPLATSAELGEEETSDLRPLGPLAAHEPRQPIPQVEDVPPSSRARPPIELATEPPLGVEVGGDPAEGPPEEAITVPPSVPAAPWGAGPPSLPTVVDLPSRGKGGRRPPQSVHEQAGRVAHPPEEAMGDLFGWEDSPAEEVLAVTARLNAARFLLLKGELEEAKGVLALLLEEHPELESARVMYNEIERQLGRVAR